MHIAQTCELLPFADPASLYTIVKTEEERASYLLESREGSDKIARYSIMGFDPAFTFAVKNGMIKTQIYDDFFAQWMRGLAQEYEHENPLHLMRAFLRRLERERTGRKASFIGGFVGYLSYDFIRYFVDVGASAVDSLKQPDCEFLLTKKNIIVDHKAKKVFLLCHKFSDDEGASSDNSQPPDTLWHAAQRSTSKQNPLDGLSPEFTSTMEKEEYERGVSVAKDYIHAGDIFQVVLSQRLEADFDADGGDALAFYTRLSEVNPSPYMYFLEFGERKIVGASPEMLVRVGPAGLDSKGHQGRKVESCPIAGTRRRGITEAEDKRLEVEMLNDEKERAEHLMLVDLSRNDVGKVSVFGTVKAEPFMYPEKYSHVQHIVTDVVGELRADKDEFDALEATFPAGTVSGAPKVRAMEIIEEIEGTRRGIYAGCVGYFSFNCAMDTAITIRTAVFEHGKVYLQAGAGIVADSDPEREYKETLSKCAALLECLSGEGAIREK